VNQIVDAGDMPASRQTLYKQVPRHVDGGALTPEDGGPSARGDGRSTAALNGLRESNFQAGQKIWIDAVVDELISQEAVTETGGHLRWIQDLHRDMTVRFQDLNIRIITAEERRRGGELGTVSVAIRGDGHLNPVMIAAGGGIPGNARFKAGQRVALEIHPLAYELPPMTNEELDRLAKDVRQRGIAMPLLLIPDHNDPVRKRTAKPGVQPLKLDKAGQPIPKLKVGDGRHRVFLASQYDLPVRLELFEGTEQEARERIVSLNIHRRMLNSVQIGILIRQLLMPAAEREAEERRRAGNRKGGEHGKSRANLPTTSDKPKTNGRAEKVVLDRLGNPIGERTLRTLEETDDAPETREKAMRGEEGYRSASAVAKKAREEKGQLTPLEPAGMSCGARYSHALYSLREARRTFDPDYYTARTTNTERIEKLQQIITEAQALIQLEHANH
jgi:hypothetical protein